MFGLAASGVPVLVALVWFVLVVGLVRRYPIVGIGMAALVLVPLWEVNLSTPLIMIGATNVTSSDVFTTILFVVGLLEFAQLEANLRGWLIPWLVLGVLLAVALLRGIAIYGLPHAVNEARGELGFYFAMTWALAIRPDRVKLHTVSLIIGWMLVLVALYHIIELHGLGSPTDVVYAADNYGKFRNRILVAPQALVLLLCAGTLFFRTADSEKGRSRFFASSLVFLGIVLLSQHRSVWVGMLVGLSAVLIFTNRRRAGGDGRGRAFALLAVGAWLAFAGWLLRSGGNEAVEAVTDSGTFEWRFAGWEMLTSDQIARGLDSIAIGAPYGSGFQRTVLHFTSGVQPHNWYVTIFMRQGLIGLVVIAALLMAAASKSQARSPEWMFLIMAPAAYAFAYSLDWFQAPWLAAAIVASLRGGVADEALEPKSPKAQSQGGLIGTAPGSSARS